MAFKPTGYQLILAACIFTIFFLMSYFQTPFHPMNIMNRTYNFVYDPPRETQAPEGEIAVDMDVLLNISDKDKQLLQPKSLEVLNATLVSETDQGKSLFSRILGGFDWDHYIDMINAKNIHEIDVSLEKLIQLLQYFIIMEPKVPVNQKCVAPPLSPPDTLNCSWTGYGTGFTGEFNKKLPKIGVLVQFGFGVDVLEIYLNEMYDVVDYFFILESTKSHYRTLHKALMWEKVKDQERFIKFADKIVHLIIDDAENAEVTQFFLDNSIKKNDRKIWAMEGMQETLRWKKFLEWNAGRKYFGDDDLLGFGDADEIPARKMVHMLKHCETKPGSVDVGIWFPFGNIKYAFATDFPIRGHKYTLGDPTFFTLKSANQFYEKKKGKEAPSRQRGTSKYHILGGIHMTHYGYLPYQFIRDLSCSECGPWPVKQIGTIAEKLRADKIRELEIEHGAVPKSLLTRIVNLTKIESQMTEIAILPWFYDCNRDRYPVWEGKHDIRLD